MTFFIRKQSPAARSAAITKAGATRYRQLKNLRIDEVSSVDRGAGEGVNIVLMKRHGTYYTPQPTDIIEKAAAMREDELIEFAKSDKCTKVELSQLIDTMAESWRQRGESREVAYTKFITEDPVGRELFSAMQAAPGRDHFAEAAFLESISEGWGRRR